MTPDQNPILSYEVEQRLRAVLAAAAASDGLRTPDRVEQALVAELRGRRRRALAGRMAAAGLLAAAVLMGLFVMQPSDPAAPLIANPQPRQIPVSERAATVVAKAVPKPKIRRIAPKAAAPAAQTEFIPVGPWQAMEPMERGSIIRVRLPKSSLAGFGIPVSSDRWNESIPADVVLGEDGSMRAIRFLKVSQ